MKKIKHYFINLYLINRAYGGPEEGGWWYDVGEVVRTFGPFYDMKRKDYFYRRIANLAAKKNKEEGRRPPSSVLCNDYYEVYQENHPGQDFPVHRPIYE